MNKMVISLFTFIAFSLNAFNSTTYIDPYKTFIVGEGSHGAFSVKVTNAGPAEILIYSCTKGGLPNKLHALKPNEKIKLDIAANTQIQFTNNNDTKSTLLLTLKGDVNLSMNYK